MTHHTNHKNEPSPSRTAPGLGGAAYNLSQLGFTVMLTSTRPMTPAILLNEVGPFLNALADLQHLINDVKKRQWPEVQLLAVIKDTAADNAPITATLKGVVDAIAFMQTIVNWRRKQADLLSQKDCTDPHLYQAKVQLALDILTKVAPRLDETQRIGYAALLLEPLEVLVTSSLEVGAYDSEDFT